MADRAVSATRVCLCALLLAISTSAAAALVTANEFYLAWMDHYFVTASGGEAAQLHTNGDWARTAFEYRVDDAPGPGRVPVCRFFSTAFAPRSSHFFTADADECAQVKGDSNWTFEGEAFFVRPAAYDGSCPIGNAPVYRLYNNGQGGAPGHRYTPLRSLRALMIGNGWRPEGLGPDGAAFCVPVSTGVAYQRLRDFAVGEWSFIVDGPSVVTVITVAFGPVRESDEPEYAYEAPITIGAGVARWNPFVDQIEVVLDDDQMRLVFTFDGENVIEGCAYVARDLGYIVHPPPPLAEAVFGPCRTVVGSRG